MEDVIYIGLGLLLTALALTLLVTGALDFVQGLTAEALANRAVRLLDRVLLVLLIVELLYTVQVSFREHALIPEPFMLVGLISAIRRVLVLTAEYGEARERTDFIHLHFVTERGVLTVLILALALALMLLRKRGAPVVAERA